MIHKKMKNSADFASRVLYIYGLGKGAHDHKVESVEHIGSSGLICLDPIIRDSSGKLIDANLQPVISQFEREAANYKPRSAESPKLVGHAVISLQQGETLTALQWNDIATEYMSALGYGDCQWIAVKHSDCDHEHAHIVFNRSYKNPDNKYRIVPTSSDYEKGMDVCRKMEQKYGLSIVPMPDESWSASYSESEVKQSLATKKPPFRMELLGHVEAAAEHARGKTWSDFIDACEELGVTVNTRLAGDEGDEKPVGVSFGYFDIRNGKVKVLSGRKIKAAKCTFQKLTTTGGITYDPQADLQRIKTANKKHKNRSPGDAKKAARRAGEKLSVSESPGQTWIAEINLTPSQLAFVRKKKRLKIHSIKKTTTYMHRARFAFRIPSYATNANYNPIIDKAVLEALMAVLMLLIALLLGGFACFGVKRIYRGSSGDSGAVNDVDLCLGDFDCHPYKGRGYQALVGDAERILARHGETMTRQEFDQSIASYLALEESITVAVQETTKFTEKVVEEVIELVAQAKSGEFISDRSVALKNIFKEKEKS